MASKMHFAGLLQQIRDSSDMSTTNCGVFDVSKVRSDFPALDQRVHGHPLVYLDNAATSQKPYSVIKALRHFYEADCANIDRGVHELSERATTAYEASRIKAKRFLNAQLHEEIVFVRGATEGINLVAASWGRKNLKEGDEVVITTLEHHSNVVPWQILCEETGAVLRWIPIDDRGELILEEYEKLLGPRTKVLAVAHASNTLGTINPIRQITEMAHQAGAVVLVDGTQGAPHMRVDVQALDADFYVFSGHKVLGPTGIGVLYGKSGLLESMPPYQSGGGMIRTVSLEKTTYSEPPSRFEAGTPNIAGAIGLGAALDYIAQVGMDEIGAYEQELLVRGTAALSTVPGLRIIGAARNKVPVLTFVMDGIDAHDIGAMLDLMGIAVRTGHHCAQPVMTRFNLTATARASLAFYNTMAEIDALAAGLQKISKTFQ
ncbi:cysteine desulfurase [Edaphobacter aggregans]|uniref:cysteine desulfurase n=1 Tax=Edaphobacter aggregans TaxID=570835 RepID=UPI001B809AF5|nr:cysteine desulfurase [Edaphobacter aggregans]